jgi:hypothetical protein
MNTCNKCKKHKNKEYFINKNKILKTCFSCREASRKWRLQNKERVSKYNKFFNQKTKNGKNIQVIFGKKKSDSEWIEFASQLDAAKKLNLHASNINKVIKGIIKTTGGYNFKIEEKEYKSDGNTWDNIKQENKFQNKCKGTPSTHRILHETVGEVIGKICCCCKPWRPLEKYNYSKTHWDNLRNDCKLCLVAYRKKNRKILTKKQLIYEKNRKKIDPNFKLMKTLRSRIGTALTAIKAKKYTDTMTLTGCDIIFLKNHIEKQFTPGMIWENHGVWHIDHIIPCCSFNLIEKNEQLVCFNWRNLQPLWKTDNLQKSGKYNITDKNILLDNVNL